MYLAHKYSRNILEALYLTFEVDLEPIGGPVTMITCCDTASENCGFNPQKIVDLRPDPWILVAGPLGELHGA